MKKGKTGGVRKGAMIMTVVAGLQWLLTGRAKAGLFADLESNFYAIAHVRDFGNVSEIVDNGIQYVLALAGLGVLFYLIYGGYHLMISQGDEKAVAEARGKITNALIGFIVIFASYWIMQIVAAILGLEGFGGLF